MTARNASICRKLTTSRIHEGGIFLGAAISLARQLLQPDAYGWQEPGSMNAVVPLLSTSSNSALAAQISLRALMCGDTFEWM